MSDLFRDTAIGQLIHTFSKGRLLPYPEDSHVDQAPKYLKRSYKAGSGLSRWTSSRNSNFLDVENPERLNVSRTRSHASRTMSDRRDEANVDSTIPEDAISEEIEKQKTAAAGYLVTWSGSDDPANPQNWSLFKKCFVTGLVCFLTFSIYIGSAIYTAGVLGVEEQFGVSQTVATLGLTVFVLGYGIGPMILAPFAEAPPIGRTPVYLSTLLVFVCFNFGVVYAKNIGMLLAFRFLTGFFGSPVLATGGASLGDMFSNSKRAYAIGIWGLFAVCGPAMGPCVSGFAVMFKGWKWSMWELVWLSGTCWVILLFTLPETSSMTILYKRTRRLRKAAGNQLLMSEADIEAEAMEKKDIVMGALWRPFQLTFTEPILLALDLYLGLVYALLYCWFEAFPITFIGVYGFNLGEDGVTFVGLLIGAVLVIFPFFLWLHYVQEKEFDTNGDLAPERRLPPAIAGSFLIPVALFWFGWSARTSVHWIMPIIGSAIFSMGGVLLFNAVLNYQGDAYPKYVGSVLAGNDLMRSAMGGAFPLFAPALYDNLGLGWGCSVLGFLAVAFIPIPILLFKYGRQIRMASKYARHDI